MTVLSAEHALVSTLVNFVQNISLKYKQYLFFKYVKRDVAALPRQVIRLAIQVESMDKGGLEQVVYNLVRSLDKNRFSVTLLICGTECGYLGDKLQAEGCDVVTIGHDQSLLAKILLERKISLVNLHYSVWGIDTYLEMKIPVVYTIHNSYTWLSEDEVQERCRAYKKVAGFIAVSNQVKRYFRERFKVPARRILTVPNGIDLTDFAACKPLPRERYTLAAQDFVFINIASFIPTKFQNIMISAMKEIVPVYPQARLLMVGNVLDTAYHAHIMERIHAEGLEPYIRIIDFVPRPELGGLFQMSDCFMLPSIQEGWSNAIMEAMYFGLPLILSDVGSARDIMVDESLGIVIPNPYNDLLDIDCAKIETIAYDPQPVNLPSLVTAMDRMIASREQWRRQAAIGKDKVRRDLTVMNMVRKYEKIFCAAHYAYLP